MRLILIILLFLITISEGNTQGNRVFTGGELANYGLVDISAVNGVSWSTDRFALPGYFSAFDTANYIGCTDSANINGYIKKYGNQSFIFPIGSGNDLRTLEMSSPSVSTDAYASAWILGNPSLYLDPTQPNAGPHNINSFVAPIVVVSSDGQWDWQVGASGNLGQGTTGTGIGLRITVSIPNMVLFAQTSSLRLVGWNGIAWIDLSGGPTASNNIENSTLSGIMVGGITAIAIGSVELFPPLALKLVDFSSSSKQCQTVLSWTTYNETNTELFNVEQSFDGIHFTRIETVIAARGPNDNFYEITIDQPAYLAYYRLHIKDTDGSFFYSEVISSRRDCNLREYLLVYPNPIAQHERLVLDFETYYRGKAEISIFNAIGQKIIVTPIQINKAHNLIWTDCQNLSAGTYLLVVLTSSGNQIGKTQKFIVQ